MSTTKDFTTSLALMRQVVPPNGMIVVGGCSVGTLAQYAGLNSTHLLMIEADEDRAERLSASIQNHDGWMVKSALISDHDTQTNYYKASNPNESGLLQPEQLTALWQNLKTIELQQRPSSTLDTLLKQLQWNVQATNWMVIDCLPALPILQGALGILTSLDIISVRAILEHDKLAGSGATKSELDVFLNNHGFCFLACEEELQPAAAKLLYVRDFKKQLTIEHVKHQQQIEQLTKDCNEQARLAEERRAQLEQAAEEKADLAASRDQQSKLVGERQQQIEQLTTARDEQARLAEERRAQLEQVAREKADLAASCAQHSKLVGERQHKIEQLIKARDEQARMVTECQTEITNLKKTLENTEKNKKQLESQLLEYEHRQQLMNEEMVKAEGQIELIKDLLLREPGL